MKPAETKICRINRLASDLVRDLVLNSILASVLLPRPFRWRALRLCGMDIQRSSISARGFYGSTKRIRIGEASFVNYGVFFDSSAQITIGKNCQIGMQVLFCTSGHAVGGSERRGGAVTSQPITVGDGVWIGARALILAGVSVGDGCIVAAGAVVKNDCSPNGVYAGVPAKRVKELEA